MAKPLRVACLEQFSSRNLGDNLALEQTMREIESVVPDVVFDVYSVIGPRPEEYFAPHCVRRVMMMPWNLSVNFLGLPVLANLPKADVVLVRGGTFFDERLWDPIYSYLLNLFFVLQYARWLRKKVILYGVGVGPLRTRISRKMASVTLNCADVLTVRDQDSLDLAKELGVGRPVMALAADPAIRLSGDWKVSQALWDFIGAKAGAQFLAVSPTCALEAVDEAGNAISAREFQKKMIESLRQVQEKTGCHVLMMPSYDGDLRYSRVIADALPGATFIDKRKWHWTEVLALKAQTRMLLGMRMHSMILATAAGGAACGIAYRPKVRSYFSELGTPELVLSTNDVLCGKLSSFLLNAWENADRIKARQLAARQRLGKRADVTLDLFRKLIGR